MQGPILIAKEFMVKSDLNLCAQKYTVCYVLAQIMVVNSCMAHLYVYKLQCSSKQKVPSRGMEIYCSRSKLTYCKEVLIWTEMNTWIQCFAKCVLSITCLTHLLDVFALIKCMLSF